MSYFGVIALQNFLGLGPPRMLETQCLGEWLPRHDFHVIHHRTFIGAAGASAEAEAAASGQVEAGERELVKDQSAVESQREARRRRVTDLDRDADSVGVGIGRVDGDVRAVDPDMDADVAIATVVVGVEADREPLPDVGAAFATNAAIADLPSGMIRRMLYSRFLTA